MTTSRFQSFLSEIVEAQTLPESGFVYFRGKLQNDVHVLILKAFLRSGLSQKELAHRIGKSRSVVNRWIGATGNWELNSIAEFLAGMNAQLKVSLDFLDDRLSAPAFRDVREPIRGQGTREGTRLQVIDADDRTKLNTFQKSSFDSSANAQSPQ